MADLSFVNERIAVGGKVDSLADAHVIAAKGITHVINVRETNVDDEPWFKKLGIEYLHNGAPNDEEPKDVDWLVRSIKWAWKALAEPKAKLLIHCKGGGNRSPSTAYAILRSFGVPQEDAEEHVEEADSRVDGITFQDDAERALRKLGFTK